VREFVEDEKTGLLAPFFDQAALIAQVVRLLETPELRQTLGKAARQKIQFYYDLKSICLPNQIRWVEFLSHVRS
jgi:glycosyltransferase involved in cell wall biosynthesis